MTQDNETREKRYKALLKKTLSCFIALLTLLGSIYFAKHQGLEWSVVYQIDPTDVIILVFLCIVSIISNACINLVLFHALDIDISYLEAFSLNAAGTWLNMILPLQGGAASRAIYLKYKLGVAYSHFIAVQGATYTFSFLIGGVLAIGLWFLFLVQGINLSLLLLCLCMVIVVAMGLILIIPLPNYLPKNRTMRILGSIIEGWNVLKQPIVTVKVFLLLIANFLLAALKFGIAFRALEQQVSITGIVFVAVLVSLSQVVRITPGNLGIREAVTGAMAEVVNSGFGSGVLVSGLIRIVSFLVMIFLGPLSSSWLSHQMMTRN